MRLTLTLAATLAAGALVASAAAQTAAGQYEGAMRRMIAATTAGTCPAEIMTPSLLTTCQQQLHQLSAISLSYGAPISINFLRSEGRDDRRVEFYRVRFATGQTMTWVIGRMKDGKFDVLLAGA